MKKLLLIVLLLLIGLKNFSQSESISFRLDAIDISRYEIGDTLYISCYCDDISDDITGWQIYFLFDTEVLSYIGIKYKQSQMTGNWYENCIGNMWAANWLDPTFKGIELFDGEKLFELTFIYNGGETNLSWSRETINESGKLVKGETMVIDTKFKPFELNLIDGCVCKKN